MSQTAQAETRHTINYPQHEFLSLTQKFRGFVGGYGSSKTYSGCLGIIQHFELHPGINAGYFAPTYPHIRDIFFETMDEVAHACGYRTIIKEGNKEVFVYEGRKCRGLVKCRSMQLPHTIIGFKIGHALVDELDLLPTDKAKIAFQKILARMRYTVEKGKPLLKNGMDITTTPEGFKFVHHLFVEQLQKKPKLRETYALVHASTYDNEKNLPADYIQSIVDAYPKELIDAYLHGQFRNLVSGTVYRSYNRKINNSNARMKKGEPLFIGMDFNVQKMAATIYIQRSTGFHAVAELKDVFDTPDMIEIIQQKWVIPGKHKIIVYPDPTGKARETVDASKSDISILQNAGFTVRAREGSTPIKDRVNAVNKAFEDGWLWINTKECPTVVKCLEQQAYDKNGLPDKTTGFDHQNDATSYPVTYERPIKRKYQKVPPIDLAGFWG